MTNRRRTSSYAAGVGSARADNRRVRQPPIAYGGKVTIVLTTRERVLQMWKARWKIDLSPEMESSFLKNRSMNHIIGNEPGRVKFAINKYQRLNEVADFLNGKIK